jgi:phosphatidylglycerol:prolipoprotein diacylglycerol transferase
MYLVWDPDPELINVGGFSVGWYGFLFALGFLLSQRLVIYIYHKEKKQELDILLVYLIIGTVVGARLAHCLFYDPGYYLGHPLAILKIWEGGLASHGAAVGLVAALFVFSQRHKDHKFLWLLDRIAIVGALTGALVRFGNFINSEIVGTPTHAGFGVVFLHDVGTALQQRQPEITHVAAMTGNDIKETLPGLVPLTLFLDMSAGVGSLDGVRALMEGAVAPTLRSDATIKQYLLTFPGAPLPYSLSAIPGGYRVRISVLGIARHPVQLYEGVFCLLLAIFLFMLWWKMRTAVPGGMLFGWCFLLLFVMRFFIEFVKEDVAPLEAGLPLKMGQILSVPFILLGAWMIWRPGAADRHSAGGSD